MDKKGYDMIMAEIEKELRTDLALYKQELDQHPDYGVRIFRARQAGNEQLASQIEEDQKQIMNQRLAERRKIREEAHFKEFCSKQQVLKNILKQDFKEAQGGREIQKVPDSLNRETGQTNQEIQSQDERIANLKAQLQSIKGECSHTFNEKAGPVK